MSAIQHTEKTIFLEAVEIASPTERAAFLEQICANDVRLRAAVEALLQSHQRSQGLLDVAKDPLVEQPGTMIGHYKLLQQIGEGGMGIVYMAEQVQPIQRRVALKLIKPGMDSRQIIARFEAERQALAMMDHVNIARVFDAGTTEAGRPYFVMELVHGVPITKYCDDNQLTPRERLELFVPVCQAIEHAHQKGIIHRDIKPSNVMITLYDGNPVPKVIDFGVAKATEQKLTERTLFTHYGTLVGTLEYMSPEQAEMSALGVDTRGDIYSLGVLLYELLTGTTPLSRKRIREAAYGEVIRMITHEEPLRPSARLSESGAALASISARRQMEPAHLTKLIRGELDWIVMKTLEKDRNRRYETVSGLAADVQRYLNDEMVQACPPSVGYRLHKFVSRNKATVLAIFSLVLLLSAAVIGTSWGLYLLDRARETADRHRVDAEQHADLLRGRLYVAEMNQAFEHWEYGEIAELLAILNRYESPVERGSFEWRYLRTLARKVPHEPVVFRNHQAIAFNAVFTPDGRSVVSCGEDRCVRFWDAKTGKAERILRPRPETDSEPTDKHHEDENCVRLSADGRHLISACEDGTVRKWDLASGTWKAFAPQHRGEVLGLALSRDGQLIAAAGVDRVVRVWTMTEQRLVGELNGHLDTIQGLAFSHDNRSIASADRSGLVILWDVEKFAERAMVRSGSGVYAVDFSPDGKWLATAEASGVVRLWNARTGTELREVGRHFGKVRHIQFSPDGKLLASCGDDNRVRIWRVDGSLAAHFRAHEGFVWSAVFSPDSTKLVTASNDRTAKVWDLSSIGPSPHWTATRNIAASHLAFAPRSQRLAISTADGRILIGNPATRGTLETMPQQSVPFSRLVFSPDEDHIIYCTPERHVVRSLIQQRGSDRIFAHYRGAPGGKSNNPDYVIDLFFPDDQTLAAVYGDGLIRMWDGDRIRERRLNPPIQTSDQPPILAVSENPVRLAIHCPEMSSVHRLDLTTGDDSPDIDANDVIALSLSPSGSILAVVYADSTVKLIDWVTGREFRALGGLRRPVSSILFSHDERTLIVGCGSVIRLWHVESGQELFKLSENCSPRLTSMALSSDESLLAVAGDAKEDGSTVTVYDIGLAD